MTTRRNFLRTSLAGFASALSAPLLFSPSARAQGEGKKLIIALAYGGWDPSFVFDPKPDNPEVDRIPGNIRNFGDLPLWVHEGRPQVTTFFEQWGSRSAVINGIAVSSLAHESCVDVMLTGQLGEKIPDLGARLAHKFGQDRAIPYLALGPQAEIKGHESEAATLGDSNQIMALATPEFAWPSGQDLTPDMGLELNADERALILEHLQDRASAYARAHATNPNSTKQIEDYRAALRRADDLRSAARAGGMLSDAMLFEDISGPWRHVAAALSEGLSQVALVQPALFWDTHGDNSSQAQVFEEFFGGLNLMMAELSERGTLDDTVIMVLSEMGRTPRHNATGGKDHWPWTSAVIIGSEVAGGQRYGETDEWMRPVPLDLASGETDEDNGVALHAGHVLSTGAALMGAGDENWFNKEPIDAISG